MSAARFLTAEWRWLVMLNYEIDPLGLKRFIPAGTELDTWEGKTFVSMRQPSSAFLADGSEVAVYQSTCHPLKQAD